MDFVKPRLHLNGFTCPYCETFTKHNWYYYEISREGIVYTLHDLSALVRIPALNSPKNGKNKTSISISICNTCGNPTFWLDELMVHPETLQGPEPSEDMPNDVLDDFQEARMIYKKSPKAAAALLRLAVQKLCIHLGGKGKDLNNDIKDFVKNGLPVDIQQALDCLRVVGNNAVHPGQIDIDDNKEIVLSLFNILNIIVERMITQPKLIQDIYQNVLPETIRESINKRDKR